MLINPLLKLALSKPHLLVEHIQAYAGLVGAEVSKALAALVTRIGLFAAAGVLVLLGVTWGGVALMLRGTLPADDYTAGWLLLVVPLVPLIVAAVLVFVARAKPIETGLDAIKKQIQADIDMVREVAAK
jgi:hypothetical protein